MVKTNLLCLSLTMGSTGSCFNGVGGDAISRKVVDGSGGARLCMSVVCSGSGARSGVSAICCIKEERKLMSNNCCPWRLHFSREHILFQSTNNEITEDELLAMHPRCLGQSLASVIIITSLDTHKTHIGEHFVDGFGNII
jgi:hypothetical protein